MVHLRCLQWVAEEGDGVPVRDVFHLSAENEFEFATDGILYKWRHNSGMSSRGEVGALEFKHYCLMSNDLKWKPEML